MEHFDINLMDTNYIRDPLKPVLFLRSVSLDVRGQASLRSSPLYSAYMSRKVPTFVFFNRKPHRRKKSCVYFYDFRNPIIWNVHLLTRQVI